MEKIKFRSVHLYYKDNSFSHFSYWGMINHKGEFDNKCFSSPSSSNNSFRSKEELFTGCIDKNGKEIFEGDIVNHNIKSEFLDSSDWCLIVGEVVSINGCLCVKEQRYPLYAFENEVIGNIHENPELLNG